MAASQSILDALNSLEHNLVEAQSFADVCCDLAGCDQGAPTWPFLVSQQVDRIRAASQALEALIRQQALPVLRDMEKVVIAR